MHSFILWSALLSHCVVVWCMGTSILKKHITSKVCVPCRWRQYVGTHLPNCVVPLPIKTVWIFTVVNGLKSYQNICLQYGISRLMGFLRGKTVTLTDQRVRLMTEILRCIKFIKMYAWENCFTKTLLSKSSLYLFICLLTC